MNTNEIETLTQKYFEAWKKYRITHSKEDYQKQRDAWKKVYEATGKIDHH